MDVENRGELHRDKNEKKRFGETGREMERWMRQGSDGVIGEKETGEMVRWREESGWGGVAERVGKCACEQSEWEIVCMPCERNNI